MLFIHGHNKVAVMCDLQQFTVHHKDQKYFIPFTVYAVSPASLSLLEKPLELFRCVQDG